MEKKQLKKPIKDGWIYWTMVLLTAHGAIIQVCKTLARAGDASAYVLELSGAMWLIQMVVLWQEWLIPKSEEAKKREEEIGEKGMRRRNKIILAVEIILTVILTAIFLTSVFTGEFVWFGWLKK